MRDEKFGLQFLEEFQDRLVFRYRYGKYGYGISIGRMAGQTVSGRKIICTGLPENLF